MPHIYGSTSPNVQKTNNFSKQKNCDAIDDDYASIVDLEDLKDEIFMPQQNCSISSLPSAVKDYNLLEKFSSSLSFACEVDGNRNSNDDLSFAPKFNPLIHYTPPHCKSFVRENCQTSDSIEGQNVESDLNHRSNVSKANCQENLFQISPQLAAEDDQSIFSFSPTPKSLDRCTDLTVQQSLFQ